MSTDSIEFIAALRDYFYLIDRKYPEKGSLKLVGDRYRLSSVQRTMLYRGVTTANQTRIISKRMLRFPGNTLIVDGYNVLITLLNYRLGHLVFVSTDGLCRDAGSSFGRIRNEGLFNECMLTLAQFLALKAPEKILLYLDEPVTGSQRHQQMAEEAFALHSVTCRVERVPSADRALLSHTKGTLATSDSAILIQNQNKIIDLPRQIIEEQYDSKLLDLGGLLQEAMKDPKQD